MKFLNSKYLKAIALMSFFMTCEAFASQRLKEMATISGYRGNALVGYGIVVGLNGTGDANTLSQNGAYSNDSVRSLLAALEVSGNRGDTRFSTTSNNVAAVIVTAELPALARPGQKLDVTVSSLGSARSLKGGTLLMTPLKAANGEVFAVAQGSLVLPDMPDRNYAWYQQSTTMTAGRIPGGAYVEQGAPLTDTENLPAFIELNLNTLDYAQAEVVTAVVSSVAGTEAVTPIDGRTIRVRVSADPLERLTVMSRLMESEIPSISPPAKVVINSRTGSVVVNQSVSLKPFAVTHGALTVRVTGMRTEVGAYATPWGGVGATLALANRLEVDAGPKGKIVGIGETAGLEEVVRALNQLGQSPKDLMAILQAIKAAGALNAELEVI
jgi:flagellar P-ring protein precursor FlgI